MLLPPSAKANNEGLARSDEERAPPQRSRGESSRNGSETASLLEQTERTLDLGARFVEVLVQRKLLGSAAIRGDDSPRTFLGPAFLPGSQRSSPNSDRPIGAEPATPHGAHGPPNGKPFPTFRARARARLREGLNAGTDPSPAELPLLPSGLRRCKRSTALTARDLAARRCRRSRAGPRSSPRAHTLSLFACHHDLP